MSNEEAVTASSTAGRAATLPTPSRNGKGGAGEGGGGGGGVRETPEHSGVEGALEKTSEEEATSRPESPVQCPDKTPALSVTDPSREHEHLDRAPEPEGASRIVGMHLPKASAGALQYDFDDPMLKTPAHSRDRDGLQWDPPQIGLPATGEVSRRIRRDKHRPTHNYSARGESAGEAVSVPPADTSSCAKTATATQSATASQTATATATATQPASATRPSSPAPVPPVSNSATERVEKKADVAAPRRRPGPKRFSYVSDTTWLRPTPETKTPAALQELGVGVTAETTSSSPVGRLPSPEGAGVSSPETGATWGGSVVPHSSEEGERYQAPSDADEPLEQGLAAEAGIEDADAGTVVVGIVRFRNQVQMHWTVKCVLWEICLK